MWRGEGGISMRRCSNSRRRAEGSFAVIIRECVKERVKVRVCIFIDVCVCTRASMCNGGRLLAD